MNTLLPISISQQDVNPWRKRITVGSLKGSVFFFQRKDSVTLSASGDCQQVCTDFMGEEGYLDNTSYVNWDNISPIDIVELIFVISRRAQ